MGTKLDNSFEITKKSADFFVGTLELFELYGLDVIDRPLSPIFLRQSFLTQVNGIVSTTATWIYTRDKQHLLWRLGSLLQDRL